MPSRFFVVAEICVILIVVVGFSAQAQCRYTPADFDGDHKTDLILFRPSTAEWFQALTQGSERTVAYGPTDGTVVATSADTDGDGIHLPVVFDPADARWTSADGSLNKKFGEPALKDIPLTGDFDGDCRTDLVTFRPSVGEWVLYLAVGRYRVLKFGESGSTDIPVPADYDGDGKTDLALFRPSTAEWRIQPNGKPLVIRKFGETQLRDIPIPGDYDGDGIADLAVFRPKTGDWFIQQSSGPVRTVSYGTPGGVEYPITAPMGAVRLLQGKMPPPKKDDDQPPVPPLPDEGYDWRREAKFTDLPVANRVPGSTFGSRTLEDVWTHARRQEPPSASLPPSTWGHETTHYLHSEHNQNGKDFIYYENGKGIHFSPAKTPNEVNRFLPEGAKRIAGSRLRTYSAQCGSRRSNALGCYLDEFGAYVITSRIATEQVQAGQYRGLGQDAVDGAMDFLYFCAAMMLATEKYDVQELRLNTQLKATFAMLAELTMKYVTLGLGMSQFNGFHARELQDHFVSSPENAAIRSWLVETYGALWTKKVFGF